MPDATKGAVHAARGVARVTLWDLVVDELEARLVAWRDAVCRRAPYPESFSWPPELGPMPARLRSRAQAVLWAQRDLELEMLTRRSVLASMLQGGSERGSRQSSVPLYVDQRS